MGFHESSVNYRNLLRDLAEMYPFHVSEVVFVELIANALDAGATKIAIDFEHKEKILTIVDNGKGMTPKQFDEYHDFAAGLKARGSGIGFAGVGAKISFNIADRVITETRRGSYSAASRWYIAKNKKLVWEDGSPKHQESDGTRVEVHFGRDASLVYVLEEDIRHLLIKHYLPLFDSGLLALYAKIGNRWGFKYSHKLKFYINGKLIPAIDQVKELALDNVKRFVPSRGKERLGFGLMGVAQTEYPLGDGICGVLVCVCGKVVKTEFFNQFPGAMGSRILGVVEVPGLVKFLTTSKTDFIRSRQTHKEFERLYDPIRQEFKEWLQKIGIQSIELKETEEARKLERELKKLIDQLPELGEFFGFRARKDVYQESISGSIDASHTDGMEPTFPVGLEGSKGEKAPTDAGEMPGTSILPGQDSNPIKADPISRKSRSGPKISFSPAKDRIEMAWVEGNFVIINSAHPCFIKSRSNSLAKRMHCLYSIGNAIQRHFASTETEPDLTFIDRLMNAWSTK